MDNLINMSSNSTKIESFPYKPMLKKTTNDYCYTSTAPIDQTDNAVIFNQDYTQRIVKDLYPSFKKEMLNEIMSSTVESGVYCAFEDYYEKIWLTHGLTVASRLLQKMFGEYFNNSRIVVALLHLISHRSYDEFGGSINSQLVLLAFHRDKRIKKFALKVIDNWDSTEMLPYLLGTQDIKEQWLNDYKNKIVQHLEAKRDALLRTCN